MGSYKANIIIKKEDIMLNFVLLNSIDDEWEMVKNIFSKVLESYLKIFPGTHKSNYLITAFYANQNDGEA